jgi:dipeptidyl aminopeptidase/acylaminoacyl peptidase
MHLPDPLPLCAVVALAPVSDLVRAWELRLSEGVVEQLLGGTPHEQPERYAAASPFALLPLGLRQVLIHGTEDVDVPFELSLKYCQAAAALGDDVTLVSLPGAGHFEPIDPGSGAFCAVFSTVSQTLGPPVEA